MALEQPQVGRHDVADAERDDVAGHEARATSTAACRAVAPDERLVMDVACSAATALAARYSLTKPSPTLSTTIARDDRRVGRIPGESRDRRRREQQQEQGIAQLARQDRDGRYAADSERVRAECAQACLGFGCAEAGLSACEALEHDLAR